jgi:hypothetical protein
MIQSNEILVLIQKNKKSHFLKMSIVRPIFLAQSKPKVLPKPNPTNLDI